MLIAHEATEKAHQLSEVAQKRPKRHRREDIQVCAVTLIGTRHLTSRVSMQSRCGRELRYASVNVTRSCKLLQELLSLQDKACRMCRAWDQALPVPLTAYWRASQPLCKADVWHRSRIWCGMAGGARFCCFSKRMRHIFEVGVCADQLQALCVFERRILHGAVSQHRPCGLCL